MEKEVTTRGAPDAPDMMWMPRPLRIMFAVVFLIGFGVILSNAYLNEGEPVSVSDRCDALSRPMSRCDVLRAVATLMALSALVIGAFCLPSVIMEPIFGNVTST
jgi:hypothetical protein